jgi:capsular exopolysaccharide synthesis family protein
LPWPSNQDVERFSPGLDQFDEGEKPFARYILGIFKRKWIVVAVFCIVFFSGVIYAFTRIPIYRSTAVVRVAMPLPSSGNAGFSDYFTNFTLYYETTVQALKSGTASGSGAGKPNRPSIGISDLDIDVSPNNGTPLITLEMTAADPLEAKRKLQDYAQSFIELQRQEVEEAKTQFLSAMEKDLRELEQQMIKSEKDLRDFAITHGLVLSTADPFSFSVLDKATDSFINIKARRLDLEISANQRQRLLPADVSDQYLNKLKKDCSTMKTEYTSMNMTYSPDYLNMRILKKKIDTFEKSIQEIESNLLTDSLAEARKEEVYAREVYERTKQDLLEKSPVAVKLSILKKAADADSKMYLALKDKLWHARLYSSMMANSLDVFSPPTLPVAPVYPNKLKIIGLGALAGLLGGIALALALDFLDKTARHIDTIRKRVDAPILGVVPMVPTITKPSDDIDGFLAWHFPVSPFADALSVVRFAASQAMAARSGTTLCVVSSVPAEGKSLLALALAQVVASENKSVVVIDGDMRKHGASDLFRTGIGTPTVGLSDWLTGKSPDIGDVIQESRFPGVSFVSSGPTSENPVALLKTRAMKQLIHECRERFDYVLIDSPPVLGMLDACVLAKHSDGALLVVKHGVTPVELIREAVRSLTQAQARVVGIVVNMAKDASGSHYEYYSHYYSRNVSQDAKSGAEATAS